MSEGGSEKERERERDIRVVKERHWVAVVHTLWKKAAPVSTIDSSQV